MAIADPEKIIPKLERDGVEKVKSNLARDLYLSDKIPVIKEWIQQKERELSASTCMYHEVQAPKGKVFLNSEVPSLIRSGWVDTPAKFGKGFRSRVRKINRTAREFGLHHWKWVISTIITTIGIVFAYLKK